MGDVYACLIEWCHGEGNMPQALQLVEQMLDRHVAPGHYLSPDVLAAVQEASAAREITQSERSGRVVMEHAKTKRQVAHFCWSFGRM